MREDYNSPVGFAKEPVEERKRWLGRILTLIFAILVGLLAYFRVFHPPSDQPTVPSTTQSELPGGG